MRKIKNKLSNLFLVLGVLFIAFAGYKLYNNINIEETAKNASENALTIIYEEMENINEDAMGKLDSDAVQGEVLVDNSLYMAILTIPTLNLELPIQSSWSYEKLKSSPCLYQSEPMSIAAHNYASHFGNIGKMGSGDTVTLKYISGDVETYRVVSVTKIDETAVEEVEKTEYDLTLFTCNYRDNTERILVRLNLV